MSPVNPFDDADAARAVVDATGILREWNEGARLLLGHPAADVVGHSAAGLLADGSAPAPPGPGRARWSGTLVLRHRDGHTVPVWVLAHRRPPEEDSPGHWFAVAPLPEVGPARQEDPLVRAALTQSPCATMIYDERLRLRGANDAMTELIGLPAARIKGLRATDINDRPQSVELERHMRQVLATGRRYDMHTHLRASSERRAHAWLARIAPLTDAEGRVRGVCVTAHDFTEQFRARERLQLVNEASVRIGTTLDVTRTAQELADVCVPALADFVSVDLLDTPDGGEPTGPLTAPVSLRRTAHRSVNPGSPEALSEPGQIDVHPAGSPQADSLTAGRTVVAAVPSEELDPWLTRDAERLERFRRSGVHATMSVPLQARGATLGVAVFTRFRRPDPFTRDDVLLAEEVSARAAVCIDNARRYSRERETTLTLQRSLLPRWLPGTVAVQAASRYLPAARAGVGGDWFDVIPLSGLRVAMVVGDVVGHGIQASATMGRLRTAVRTLADIDLPPDELLTHLDDLVVRLSAESGDDDSTGEVGATCLYAVYDPMSRRCTLARAGHPAPVLVPPDGPPVPVDLPAGPPLGLGGLPFESAELSLREGSVLAFYTDGLLEHRDRDVDTGRDILCEALAASSGSLDEACDRVLHALLPAGGAADDVALLLARTRGLPASQVATWDIPADPALVAPVRKQVLDQLAVWHLDAASFTTELVVSELVTNAIRYGAPPIRLRLIHDESTLICEVSDTSPTAPHLRRAKTWDEGGRGLLLVAQLTQRWGSRHTPEGKTIWAELALLDEM
ncbi:SpoIIE family protein phosphatase [Streptomyces sp. DH24]|uniref:SpoIIE family protein phosphatase n=1 Tax=Streptomyces sp. DH24 TaxID=3040123 RepID=UPI00244284BD|nr:SpoIIE family protein phosphatase [Streptomyces sp. DH24]MDG9717335.1 SpoIIE family protein phosphatase [Streptomyces sp. DH24]